MNDPINIDAKPTLEEVWAAKVKPDPAGIPVLTPATAVGWNVLRHFIGQTVVVRVERPKAVRSQEQNAYYWAVVLQDVFEGLRELAVSHGERCPFSSKDDLHAAFKYMFIGTQVVNIPCADGGQLEWPSTTTTLTTAQFSSYVEKILRWAGDRGIPVRQAGE